METVKQLAQYAGPIALAAFAGTLLGGIALSFFWKSFGPWKLLEETKAQLVECQKECANRDKEVTRIGAEMADIEARYNLLTEAMHSAGLGLTLSTKKGR